MRDEGIHDETQMSNTELLSLHPNNGQIQADEETTPSKEESSLQPKRPWWRENLFLVLTLCSIVVGFALGLGVNGLKPSKDVQIWIGLPGEIFLRILKAIILPLIVCTVIDGTASTDIKSNGQVGVVTMVYILCTNTLGSLFGLFLGGVIKPGSISTVSKGGAAPDTKNLQTIDIFADFFRNIFPSNIVGATLYTTQTKYTKQELTYEVNVTGHMTNVTEIAATKSPGLVTGTNMLGLIVISTAFGIAASRAGEKGRHFSNFFKAGAVVIFKLFDWIKWTTPIGTTSLIAGALVGVDNIISAFITMGLLVATVVTGVFVYNFIILPLIVFIFTRKSPLKYLASVSKAALMSIGPPNSTIPIPEMMEVSVEQYGVDPRVAGFVLPFCVTLNRDGSAMFIGMTCFFMAQYSGITLSAGTIVTLGVLVIMSSLAIPAVASASVVAILIILETLGLPAYDIGLVMAVEWITDRLRTTANVMSHMTALLVTWRMCKKNYQKIDQKEVEVV